MTEWTDAAIGWRSSMERRNFQKQDVRANILCAVLAVRWPVVNVVIVWLDPEVLLSLLRKIRVWIIPRINHRLRPRISHGADIFLFTRSAQSRSLEPSPNFKKKEHLVPVHHALAAITIVAVLMPARVSNNEPNRCNAAVPNPSA